MSDASPSQPDAVAADEPPPGFRSLPAGESLTRCRAGLLRRQDDGDGVHNARLADASLAGVAKMTFITPQCRRAGISSIFVTLLIFATSSWSEAQTQLQPQSCTTPVRSMNGDTPVTVVFENQTTQSVSVWWVDYAGVDQPWFTLPPGGSYSQGTYSTHPWRVIAAALVQRLRGGLSQRHGDHHRPANAAPATELHNSCPFD